MLDDRRREMVSHGPIDLSMVDITGGTLSARETANCYVIQKTGTYMFPIIYGCGIVNGVVNSASYTRVYGTYTEEYTQEFYGGNGQPISSPFIETNDGTMSSVEVIQVDTVGFEISNVVFINGTVAGQNCRFVQFDVTAIPLLGANAIIAVKNSANTIRWSWHIWAYPFTLSTFTHINTNNKTYNFLDVNLGWVKSGSTTSKYGSSPYYQTGRKDPLLRYGATSGTVVNSPNKAYMQVAIANPTTMFTSSKAPLHWYVYTYFINYWNADAYAIYADKPVVKTVYDPSPVGFTIPCPEAFLGFTANNGGAWDNGYTWDGNYFQANGELIRATVGEYNSYGFYHMSVAYDYDQQYEDWSPFYAQFYNGVVNSRLGNHSANAIGMSIRPVLRT